MWVGKMRFKVLGVADRVPAAGTSKAYLIEDNWDDWFKYSTLYSLVVFDEAGTRHRIGGVKVGEVEMNDSQRRPDLPSSFTQLEESFFSLGQDSDYYEKLNSLTVAERDEILLALRDIAADPQIFSKVRNEEVTKISLLRTVPRVAVQHQFHRLSQGGARLTEYNFTYTAPKPVGAGAEPLTLHFAVEPESQPPTNIHVLIGRNGVGKTRLLSKMTDAIAQNGKKRYTGEFTSDDEFEDSVFANLVSVTFSAFDDFIPLRERRDEGEGVRYAYVGLKRPEGSPYAGKPKSPPMLANEFVKSVRTCLVGAKLKRWKDALETLEADPIFKEAELATLADVEDPAADEFKERATSLFGLLSSGHKVVLLTITRLVETVEERTLVLLDEPEAHLHPPLLAAFVRALSDLLINRNGVAIIATHSPVILQEVPTTCVWKLRRSGYDVHAERPEVQTFGENVGILTREVFGLEVTEAGFHRLLTEEVDKGEDYEAIVATFGGRLGSEAKALVRALVSSRDRGRQ